MAHIVQCRLCRCKLDTETEESIIVGKRSYYHKKCYEEWIKNRNSASANGDEDFWKETVIDFLYRDVKMTINFQKLDSQWSMFTKPDKKMTPKGIYFALKYHYEVKNGKKEDSQGGIGIVPYIYQESAQYWTALENKKQGTLEAIIKQIEERRQREVVRIVPKKEQPKRQKWDLNKI